MIVKSTNSQRRSFHGVDFVLLSHGQESMVTKMLYKASDSVPLHKHPCEQSGYVISGEYRIHYLDNDVILKAGDSYTIPRDTDHSIEIINAGEIVDVFSPPREDYL